MSFDSIEYRVGDLAVAPQLLTVDRQGHARYASHTNWSALDRPEMGLYETTLSADELRQLDAALAEPRFDTLADHWGRVKSGERFRRITVITGQTQVEKLVGSANPVDPALARVLARLDALVAQISQHPRQVLRLELRDLEVGRWPILSFTMALTAIGSEALTLRSPADLVGGRNGALSVALWHEGPGAESVAAETVTHAAASARRIGAAPGPAGDDAVVRLAPGSRVEFFVEVMLRAARPGPAQVRLSYANYSAGSRQDQLVGELLSKAMPIVVPLSSAPPR